MDAKPLPASAVAISPVPAQPVPVAPACTDGKTYSGGCVCKVNGNGAQCGVGKTGSCQDCDPKQTPTGNSGCTCIVGD